MTTTDVQTTATIARLLGISRQGLTQAMARSLNPPASLMMLGDSRGYDVAEVTKWWKDRLDGRTAEWQERRRVVSAVPTAQLNIRVTSREVTALHTLRQEGETLSATARRVLRLALGTDDNS